MMMGAYAVIEVDVSNDRRSRQYLSYADDSGAGLEFLRDRR